MGESTNYHFNHREVVEALIKHQDLHEGIWQLVVTFALGASNIATAEDELAPSAIIPIKSIGLLKVDKESSLAVDATKVNPAVKV